MQSELVGNRSPWTPNRDFKPDAQHLRESDGTQI